MKYLPGMKEELFQIKLDETGKKLLTRISRWASFLYICCVLTCIFDLINAYLAIKAFLKYSDGYEDYMKFSVSFNIIFLIIYAVLLPIQAYYFLSFSRKARKAIQYEDSFSFNNSFKWLLKHVIIAIILFTLNSIWAFLITIREFSLMN